MEFIIALVVVMFLLMLIVLPEAVFFFLPALFFISFLLLATQSPQGQCIKRAQETNELTDFCKKVVEDYSKNVAKNEEVK